MRISALIAVALLSLPVHAANVNTFNKDCMESEAIIVSLRQEASATGEVCHYGQLTQEDLSYVQSVQASAAEPLTPPVIVGEVCHYGQLTEEDLAQVESVQPQVAVRITR